MEILATVISSAALVLIAIIEAKAARNRKTEKHDKERAERRAATRERESRLSMEMMAAACALSLVTAKKVTGMHTNGDVADAMDKAEAAQEAYRAFLRDITAHQVAK